MLGFIGLDALIKLIEKYKFYYITRFIAYIDAVENLNFLKQSNITVPINNLIFSVTRVQDVYSPDIKNESGVAIKIHDGFFEYSSIIFSDNEKIFNTDGYCFHNKVNFHDLHKTIYNILEFKMSKTIRNNVYPPLASYYNFFNNGNLNGGQSIDGRYSNIKISVPDFTKKSSFPDVYVLSLNFKNLPPEQNAHEVTTYLWNKDRGVVKFVDRRTLSMDKSEITLLINFPVTIGKEELRNSDSIKVDIADGVNGNRKIIFTKLLDFDPNYYLGGTKNEVSIKIKEQNWVFDRVYTLKDFEDKLTETAGLEPQKGVIFLGETVDYYGFYVRKTKTSFDFIFLKLFAIFSISGGIFFGIFKI